MSCLHLARRALLSALGLLAVTLPPAPASAAADKVRIALQFGMPFVPFYVAESEGLFKKHLAAAGAGGVAVELPRISGSAALNDAMISGSVDMAVYGITGLMIAWDRTRGGASAVIGLAGVTSAPAKLVTLRPDLKSVRDLNPSDRVAIPALISYTGFVLRMVAEKEFGKTNALDSYLVAMAHPDAMNALIGKSEITVHVALAPFYDWELKQPGAHVILNTNDVLGKATTFALGVRQGYAEANPPVMKAIIAALDEANALIKQDARRAAEIYLKNEPLKQMDAAFIAEVIGAPDNIYATDIWGTTKFTDFLVRTGAMKTKPASWKDLYLPYIHDRPGD